MSDRGLERRHAFVTLARDQITEFIAPVFGANALRDVEPLSGGKINSNYKLSLNVEPFEVVLRLYARGQQTCQVERDVLRAVEGRVPAPSVLHDGANSVRPFLVISWVQGAGLDETLKASNQDHASLGKSAAQSLAKIHAVTFSQSGFFGEGLKITHPMPHGQAAFLAFVGPALEGRAAQRLGPALTQDLQTLISWAAPLLDTLPARSCLIHSDFNPPNLMSNAGKVSAVLDWEFAHAGEPLTDIANMLRPRGYQSPAFEGAFTQAYEEAAGPLPKHWQSLSRLLDLMSQIEMLDAADERPNLFEWACQRIADTISYIDANLKTT